VDEIITPSQVAALLKIHVRTVYRLAEAGVIPGNRIGRNWRFSKENVLELVSRMPNQRTEGDGPPRPRHRNDQPAEGNSG
jgi:excisionase family DNA binding protein